MGYSAVMFSLVDENESVSHACSSAKTSLTCSLLTDIMTVYLIGLLMHIMLSDWLESGVERSGVVFTRVCIL